MVNVSTNTKGNINISATPANNVTANLKNNQDVNANTNNDYLLSKSWAVGKGLIQNEDYSAKHYAQQAKTSQEIAESAVEDIDIEKQSALSDIQTAKTVAITGIDAEAALKTTEITNTASDFEDDLTALTTRAETAANNSESFATNAETSANAAYMDKERAYNAADTAERFSNFAGEYAQEAETSANAAIRFSRAAANDANSASQSAANASISATTASNAATSAVNSANQAINAKDTAENFAQQAEQAKEEIEVVLGDYVPKTTEINGKALNGNITLNASDVGALANTTKYGKSIAYSLDSTTYILTLTLKDQDNNALNSINIDLPLESYVLSVSYDSTTKELVISYQSGSTIRVPIGDIIGGLQTEITSTNMLSSDLVDDTNNAHKFATASQLQQITTNATNIGTINTTLSGYGNIVTHNVGEFATSAQGAKADTAIQKIEINGSVLTPDINNKVAFTVPLDTGDLTNNAGYITGINQADVLDALGFTPYNASNPDGFITSSDLPTNYVTTDTVQDISGRKTFLGEKAIYFKQQATSNKLGFTLYNPSNTELAALEYRPNTIGSAPLLALNCPQTTGGYVGFRYWGSPAVNIVAPKVATAGNYFIATHITNGTLTVTADNQGTVNISTLLPDVSGFATQAWVQNQNYITSAALNDYVTNTSLATTLADYVTNSALTTTLADYALMADIPTKTSDLTNDSSFATVSQIPTNNNQLTNGAGYITSSALNGYATESFVTSQGYITGITSSDVTTALGYTPYNSTNPNGYITGAALNGYAKTTDLATVATSGSYNDLTDKPYIPSGVVVDQTFDSTSQNAQSGVAIAGAGFLTGITSGMVTTALGYTPYNSSNPSGYQANVIETVKVNGTALTVTSKAVDVTVPTKVSDLTNDSGYTTNVGTVTKVNNTSPDSNGNVTISIPSAVTETTVSGWGFTKNSGTVTSVNNVSPVNGNVTLSIPDIEAYTAAEVQTLWSSI